MRVYLDSCVVIYLHEGTPELRQRLVSWLRPATSQLPQPCVSELVRLECRVGAIRRGEAALSSAYDAFFTLPALTFLPMNRDVFERATLLRAANGLHTPDALHVATALLGRCDEFWTSDVRLARQQPGLQVRVLAL